MIIGGPSLNFFALPLAHLDRLPGFHLGAMWLTYARYDDIELFTRFKPECLCAFPFRITENRADMLLNGMHSESIRGLERGHCFACSLASWLELHPVSPARKQFTDPIAAALHKQHK